MKTTLGKQETQLLAYLQMRKRQTVKTGELTGPLQLSSEQERELFRRMARGGLIARVRPGLYLVPAQLPLGGAWSPDEILALNTLMEDRQGRYQICGPNAFNRYGFDEQIPTRVYAYNNRISGERSIGAVALTLVKVADARMGDTEEVMTAEGRAAVYSSRVRTLVDAVYDWSRFNSLPRAYDWIRGELAASRVSASALVVITLRYGDMGTIRRIGLLLERQGAASKLLRKLEEALTLSTGLIPWNPAKPKRGTISRRWGVVVNEGA
jgi:predicted transcriptional regulator of viral defense system